MANILEQKPQEEDASILKFPKGLKILFFYFVIISCPDRNFSTILKLWQKYSTNTFATLLLIRN